MRPCFALAPGKIILLEAHAGNTQELDNMSEAYMMMSFEYVSQDIIDASYIVLS